MFGRIFRGGFIEGAALATGAAGIGIDSRIFSAGCDSAVRPLGRSELGAKIVEIRVAFGALQIVSLLLNMGRVQYSRSHVWRYRGHRTLPCRTKRNHNDYMYYRQFVRWGLKSLWGRFSALAGGFLEKIQINVRQTLLAGHRPQVFHIPLGDQTSLVQQADPVAQGFCLGEVMR